ncbi:helix-turn-helix transcriptional regulator [Vibrio vulnificus]|nr:helix-turn-helix transcriptional regulator [Vibrio vulnificus]
MNREQIGKILAEARKEKGLTQAEASKQCKIVSTTISKIENGRFTGSYKIFEWYVEFLGYEFCVQPRVHRFPKWDEIDELFKDDS